MLLDRCKLVFIMLIISSLISVVQAQTNESEKLYKIFKKEREFRKTTNKMLVPCDWSNGISPISVEGQLAFLEGWKGILTEINAINRSKLDETDQVSYDMFRFIVEDAIAQIEFETYLIPIDSDSGFHIDYVYLVGRTKPETIEEFEAYIEQLAYFKSFATQHIELMRLGIQKGMTLPRIILDNYESGIDPHVVDNPSDSYFATPFKNMPTTFTEKEKHQIRDAAWAAIDTSIIAGYKMFSDFIKNEYRPAARTTLGATNLPKGKEYYQQRVNYYSTLDMTADEIFELGQQEVARIRKDMEAVIKEVNYDGSFAEFLNFLRTDQQFYCDTPECLLKEASYLSKKIDGVLPQYFGKLPRLSYGVEAVPAAIAPKYTTGRYSTGSAAEHRAGFYWVNTYNLPARPLYVLPALTLHEAVPGHHLQISLAEEIEGLPPFRTQTYLSAYGEGWALYCEWLGEEMGIYTTPYTRFGRMTYEMWRACRLVVDVGMHAKGWTRQEAVDFMASNTALSMHEVNTEIDRYIGWPAQALSYKIGELKIRELRQLAEEQLEDQFNLRDFHDLILKNGAVPLFILDKQVKDWIKSYKD